jgi:hypothetical protein
VAATRHTRRPGSKLGKPSDELLIPRALGLQDLDAQFGGPLCDRTGGELVAPATRRIGPGDHGDQFMAGLGQRIQRRDCDIGGAAKDDSHRRSLGRLRQHLAYRRQSAIYLAEAGAQRRQADP